MNHRTDSFVRRFKNAQALLGAQDVRGLVSFKHRDDNVVPSEYPEFIDDYLKRNLNLDVSKLDGSFGGQAWLVTDKSGNKLILVEHETGLEILGAVGSIASLIALLPLISSGWTKLRQRFFHRQFDRPHVGSVEIRQLNQKNVLIEKHTSSVEVYVFSAILQDYSLLQQKVAELEEQVRLLKKPSLSGRKKKKTRKKKSKRKK